MATATDISDQVMFDLSVELIRRSHGQPPVVHMKLDAAHNLERIFTQTHVLLPEATRVDFIRNETLDIGKFAGALVYDKQGKLLIRIDNALVGYEGSGPRLSKRLLELLEAPPELFNALQVKASDRSVYGFTVQITWR